MRKIENLIFFKHIVWDFAVYAERHSVKDKSMLRYLNQIAFRFQCTHSIIKSRFLISCCIFKYFFVQIEMLLICVICQKKI